MLIIVQPIYFCRSLLLFSPFSFIFVYCRQYYFSAKVYHPKELLPPITTKPKPPKPFSLSPYPFPFPIRRKIFAFCSPNPSTRYPTLSAYCSLLSTLPPFIVTTFLCRIPYPTRPKTAKNPIRQNDKHLYFCFRQNMAPPTFVIMSKETPFCRHCLSNLNILYSTVRHLYSLFRDIATPNPTPFKSKCQPLKPPPTH